MRVFILMAWGCFMAACNSGTSGEKNETGSLADSLLQQVIDGHDVAMPKMMKLERLRKEAQNELDSLKKKPTNENATRMAVLDSTVKNLSYADVAMNEWMEGFRYDSLKNDETARVAYLRMQLESVNKMNSIVISSIAKADSVLAK